MVTIFKNSKSTYHEKSYQLRFFNDNTPQIPNKKGLTTFNSCKPFIYMVGTRGFEPRPLSYVPELVSSIALNRFPVKR